MFSNSLINQREVIGNVAQIAQQPGLHPHQAGVMLAQVLPHVIDHFMPTAAAPAGAQAPSSGLPRAALNASGGLRA